MTGHGGENFLKFQDAQEITSQDLAHSIEQMEEGGRFNNLLLIVDTCQAKSMCDNIRTPGVTCLASSLTGESSYSYQVDEELGVAVLDRFTWAMLELSKMLSDPSYKSRSLKKGHGRNDLTLKENTLTIQDLFDLMDPKFLGCHPSLLAAPPPSLSPTELLFTDFFASTQREIIELPGNASITDRVNERIIKQKNHLQRRKEHKISIDSIDDGYRKTAPTIPSTTITLNLSSGNNDDNVSFLCSSIIIMGFLTIFIISIINGVYANIKGHKKKPIKQLG